MTKEGFQKLWSLTYPNTAPISYLFKNAYQERWLRIHSLPNSKRYPDDDNEWEILLKRQNDIITDLFGMDSSVLLITGEYNWGKERIIHITDEEEVLKTYLFTQLDEIDLYKLNAEDYDEGEVYRPAFAEIFWKPNLHDELLIEIAKDNIRAFFLSFEKNTLVAPYDGGIDLILKDSLTKNFYRNKYTQWLSIREDGM